MDNFVFGSTLFQLPTLLHVIASIAILLIISLLIFSDHIFDRTTEDDGMSFQAAAIKPNVSEYIDAADIPSSVQQWHDEEITSDPFLGDTQQTLVSMLQITPFGESINGAENTGPMDERFPTIPEDGYHGNTENQVLQRGIAGDVTEHALTQVYDQQEQDQTVPKLTWTSSSERNVEHGNHDHYGRTVDEDPEINFSLQESQTLVKTVQSADKDETKAKEI